MTPRATDLTGVLLLATYGLLAGSVLVLVVPVLGFLWDTRPWALMVLLAALAATAVALWRRARSTPVAAAAAAAEPGESLPARHPGILINAIPVAGGTGLAVVLGYLVMFWFGLPGLRPLVVGVWVLRRAAGGRTDLA